MLNKFEVLKEMLGLIAKQQSLDQKLKYTFDHNDKIGAILNRKGFILGINKILEAWERLWKYENLFNQHPNIYH